MKNISRVNSKTLSIELVDHLEIMSVSDLIVYNTMLFIHKIVLGKAPQYLTNKIKFKYESLRNSCDIKLTTALKSTSQNALFYKGIKKYNSLPKVITNEKSLNIFEKLLKIHIISERQKS